jgi:mannose-6-phosphate isomerase-like protein (cupin superfamily)
MMHTTLFLLLLVWVPFQTGDPAGFVFWSNSTLKDFSNKLAPKINAQKVATQQLGQFGNHSVMVAYREGSGEAELHETQVDIFVVQTGQATLVVGGSIVGGKSTGPGEIRGASISGGEKKKLAAGDIVHIPAKTPHQVILDSSQQFTYVIVKIDAK